VGINEKSFVLYEATPKCEKTTSNSCSLLFHCRGNEALCVGFFSLCNPK
jgi:hypothetical protein